MVSNFIASLVLLIRRFILLIIVPYKTMRRIVQENDQEQVFIFLFLILIYFVWADKIRSFYFSPIITFLVFLLLFSITVLFFYFISFIFNKTVKLKSFIFSYAYSLYPTLIWFITNSIIYLFLPPPRTMSFLGRGFSIFFIAFSVSLLVWKIILVYLSLRFSGRLTFYRIIFIMILYLCLLLPISVLLYQLKIFRIPFI